MLHCLVLIALGFVIRYAVAGQMLGTAIGPTIAASVVEPGNVH